MQSSGSAALMGPGLRPVNGRVVGVVNIPLKASLSDSSPGVSTCPSLAYEQCCCGTETGGDFVHGRMCGFKFNE